MKKLSALIISAAIMLSFTACQKNDSPAVSEKEKIYVGTEAGFAPYEYMSGDTVVGVDMDIAKAIAEKLGKELVIKNMDFDGALNAVAQGQVDFVAAAVSVLPEREKVMDFSKSYVDSTEVVVINKGDNSFKAVDDLGGRIIGVQQGNIADEWVTENYKDSDVKRYTKFIQASEDLKNKKIDCIVMDYYPAIELVKANECFEILGKEAPLFGDRYAIAVKKGNSELLDTINSVIDELIANGKIEEFTKNHTNAQ